MKYFNLFSNILITKGAKRILVSDLQRNNSELYPIELYEIIEELKKNSIESIVENYDEESQQIIYDYIDLLIEQEYGFISYGNPNKNFIPLSYQYQTPAEISDIFIEIHDLSVLNKIKQSIENLGVKHLNIFCKKELSVSEFQEIDTIFIESVLNSIHVFSPFSSYVDQNFLNTLHHTAVRISNLVFYGSKKSPQFAKNRFRFTVHFIKEELEISSCGKVDLKYFNTNQPKVLEAINHNSCLHKKIGIDIDGNIKNCPLMPEVYGNIHNSGLEDALRQPGFKKYWNLTKDHIEGCKDCEFRYICTDCRAYTERNHTDSEGLDISKPLKCGYDPYTGQWEEWSKNPLKQKMISDYKL